MTLAALLARYQLAQDNYDLAEMNRLYDKMIERDGLLTDTLRVIESDNCGRHQQLAINVLIHVGEKL